MGFLSITQHNRAILQRPMSLPSAFGALCTARLHQPSRSAVTHANAGGGPTVHVPYRAEDAARRRLGRAPAAALPALPPGKRWLQQGRRRRGQGHQPERAAAVQRRPARRQFVYGRRAPTGDRRQQRAAAGGRQRRAIQIAGSTRDAERPLKVQRRRQSQSARVRSTDRRDSATRPSAASLTSPPNHRARCGGARSLTLQR